MIINQFRAKNWKFTIRFPNEIESLDNQSLFGITFHSKT